MKFILQGRSIVKGEARGEALVTTQPISFMGGINPKTGMIIERGHELEGKFLKGKVFVFPTSKGSTGGSYMLYDAVKNGVGPVAIINKEAESIVAIGAIVSELPMVDRVDIDKLKMGDMVSVNASTGEVEIERCDTGD